MVGLLDQGVMNERIEYGQYGSTQQTSRLTTIITTNTITTTNATPPPLPTPHTRFLFSGNIVLDLLQIRPCLL